MDRLNIGLPEGFLEEETRCGYTISPKMKKIWAVELDLFAQFDRVCRKYGITYFADGGTALGAVRHGGFIPWDDDFDVMLFRDEYERFCQVAPMEFEHPYFFQTEYTDPGTFRGHAQLRNSDTTAILRNEAEDRYPFNQGIFIDIFPLDAMAPTKADYAAQRGEALRLKEAWKRIYRLTDKYNRTGGVKGKLRDLAHSALTGPLYTLGDYDRLYRQYEQVCQRFNDYDTKYVGAFSFTFDKRSEIRLRDDLQETVELPFEFLTVPVPKNFEHALTQVFGEWRAFVRGGSAHGGVFFDPDRPYTDYISGKLPIPEEE